MTETDKSDAVVLKEFFGKREGQTLTEFVVEMRQLTDEDKQQLADGIRNGSLTY